MLVGSDGTVAVTILALVISYLLELVVVHQLSAGKGLVKRSPASWYTAVLISGVCSFVAIIGVSQFLGFIFIAFYKSLSTYWSKHQVSTAVIYWGIQASVAFVLPALVRVLTYSAASTNWSKIEIPKRLKFVAVSCTLLNFIAIALSYGIIVALNHS